MTHFFCAKRHSNRRTAGGRYIFSIQISLSTTKAFAICRPRRRGIRVQSCPLVVLLFLMLDIDAHVHAAGAVVAIGNAIMAVDGLRGLFLIVPIAQRR